MSIAHASWCAFICTALIRVPFQTVSIHLKHNQTDMNWDGGGERRGVNVLKTEYVQSKLKQNKKMDGKCMTIESKAAYFRFWLLKFFSLDKKNEFSYSCMVKSQIVCELNQNKKWKKYTHKWVFWIHQWVEPSFRIWHFIAVPEKMWSFIMRGKSCSLNNVEIIENVCCF